MKYIEDFYHTNDGDDWSLAFRRAIESFDPSRGYAFGGRIMFGPRTYRFQQTVHIDRQIILDGEGGLGWFGATQLLFDAGVSGIFVHHLNTWQNSPGANSRGTWSVIQNLVIRASGQNGSVADGITLLDRATIENVWVNNFSGIGVRIEADVNRTPPTNANTWRINNVLITECGSHGLWVNGGDTNAGVAIALDSSSNGGWGVFDSSFLGNTYIGAHTATNLLGGYKSDNRNARNLFLNCYAESDQNPAEIEPPAMVIGGLLKLSSQYNGVFLTGEGFEATFPNGARSLNQKGSVDVIGRIGSPNVGNVAYELVHANELSWPWRMTFDDNDNWWKMRWAGVAQVAYALSVNATTEGRGQFWMPNGFWFGDASNKSKQQTVMRGQSKGIEFIINGIPRFVGWANSAPETGTFNSGDIIWNSGDSTITGWRYYGDTWNQF